MFSYTSRSILSRMPISYWLHYSLSIQLWISSSVAMCGWHKKASASLCFQKVLVTRIYTVDGL